jgi:transposase-like protein
MAGMRKSYPDELKAKVALEAIKEQKTLEEISSIFQVPVAQITRWKKQAKESLVKVFSNGKSHEAKEQEVLIERLYRELGKMQVEYEWFKKKVGAI